ncbi:MAG TPA: hypothetical protein VNK23_03590 [Candidatus Dormibacteraeota bacterium]|nr:hypothetical protein [Candidatus Dormibacteraeota bacterium]
MDFRSSAGMSRRGLLRNAILRAVIFFAFSAGLLLSSSAAGADSAAFDLAGPPIEMRLTRNGATLPISEAADLEPGDRLWIQTELPADQSVHYLLVVVFLQGPTNPPPEKWFTEAETWEKHFRQEGIVVTVPRRAQQALVMLAPETGGGFAAVRNAVRSKPGVFVRAARDLNNASLQRARLDAYLSKVAAASQMDPQELKQRSALLARTLAIKLDQDCFSKPANQQESCLVQGNDQLLLQDNSQSMVTSLTSGPSADLIGAVSSTPFARSGYYSPYIGSVVDLVRIMGSLRSPNYEYIPALTIPKDDELNLRLNAPPSFHNPKSVLVVGLPPVDATQAPEIRALDPKQVYCLGKSSLALPVTGAPVLFSTKLGHDFYLQLKDKAGKDVKLPAVPDATRGGFVVDTSSLHAGEMAGSVDGMLEGTWGFQPFTGPTFHFRSAVTSDWTVAHSEQAALVVGHDDTVDLRSPSAVCVDSVSMQYAAAKPMKVNFKAAKTDAITVALPLKAETPGPFKLLVTQYGSTKAVSIDLRAYADEAKLDHFLIHQGDSRGILVGARLDEVATLELSGVRFVAGDALDHGSSGQLQLAAQDKPAVDRLKAGSQVTAHVTLKDGRVLNLPTTIEAPRPKVTLMSVSVQSGPLASFLTLGNTQELPQQGSIVFALKSDVPAEFPRAEKIEVATADGSSDVLLSVDRGNLILQDSRSLLATLDPLKAFGPSAFGPLRFRPVDGSEDQGDWQPLATLVRIPMLKEVRCPATASAPCTLTGQDLYLVDAIASDPSFAHAVSVPFGYAAVNVTVPRPDGTLLYIKLRDDPSTVDTVALPVLPDAQ